MCFCGTRRLALIARYHGGVFEIHVNVRLGHNRTRPDTACGRVCSKYSLLFRYPMNLCTCGPDLRLMPLTARRRRVVDPFYRRALALLEELNGSGIFSRLLSAKQYCVAEVWRRLLERAGALPDSADCSFATPASKVWSRTACLFSCASQRAENCCTLRISGRIDDGAG